jgi:hypothetical protein
MNHAALSLPVARFSSTVGYDDPPHLATVSIRFTIVTIDLYAHIIGGVFLPKGSGGYPHYYPGNQSQRQLNGYSSTPGITQSISFPPGTPRFGYYAPAIPVSVTPSPFLAYTYDLSYRASNCRKCPLMVPQVTYLFLTT